MCVCVSAYVMKRYSYLSREGARAGGVGWVGKLGLRYIEEILEKGVYCRPPHTGEREGGGKGGPRGA